MNYQKARIKLTNTQLSKLKSAAKHETGTTLSRAATWIILTTRITTKIRNAIAKNMSTDKKLCKAQLPKMNDLIGWVSL